jgi:hypothetical protein
VADNEVSGSVNGPVLQARDIYGPVYLSGGPGLVSVAVPVGRVEHEVRGRSELLDSLAGAVGRVVLCGAGGFGKTTVALALATRLKAESPAHPLTLHARHNFAFLLLQQGNLAGAEAEYRGVLASNRGCTARSIPTPWPPSTISP